MKKILSFLLVVFLAVTLFASASCNGDSQSPTSSQTSSISSESNSSATDSKPSNPSSSATDSKPSSSDSNSSGGTITPTPKPSTELVGSWTCVSFKVDDAETLSSFSAEGLSFVATFYDDWTFTYGMLQGSKTSFLFVEGTFTVNGNTINAVCDDETYVFTLDSDGFLIQTDTSSSQTSVSKFQKGLLAPTPANKFIGYWDCTSFSLGGDELLTNAGITASFNVSSSSCSFTFKEGSTSKITYGTYTMDGDSLTFTPSNPSQQPVTFTLNENGELVCNTTFESASTVITLYRGSLAPVPPIPSSKYLGVWELDKTYENSVETLNENKITMALLSDQTVIYALEGSSGMDGIEGTYYVSGNDVVLQIMGERIPCRVNDDGKIVVTVQSGKVTTTMEFVKISSTTVSEDVVGEYNIYSYFVDGEDQTYSSSNVKITLNSDGSASYTTSSGTENGKYFVNGNTVVFSVSRYYAAIAFNVQSNGDLSLTASNSSQTTSITWRKNYVAPPALTLSDLVGKWQLKKFTYNGTEQTLSYSETVEFKSDDTVTFTTTSGTNVSTQNGTYSFYGTTVNITVNGSTVTYTVTDGILFCAQQSGTNTFTMQYEKSSSSAKVNYAGTWELEKIVVGGQQQTLSVSQNVIINANGTFSIVTVSTNEDETVPVILNGTYVISGNTITLTPSRGDALTLQFDGEKLVSFIQDESEETQGQIIYKKGTVSSSSIVGTYDYVSLVIDGVEKITGDGNYDGTYVFNADGTFTLDETYNGSNYTYNGYYVLNGASLTLLQVDNYDNSHSYLTIDASGNLINFSNDYYVISQKEGATTPTDANIVGQWTNVSFLVDGKETIDVDNAIRIEFTADGKTFNDATYVVSGNVVTVDVSRNKLIFVLDALGNLVGNFSSVDGDAALTFSKGDITPASPARHDVVGTWDSVSIYIDGTQNTEFTSHYTFFDDGTVAYKEIYAYCSPYEMLGIYEIRLGGVIVYLDELHFIEFVDGGKLYESFDGGVLYQATFQKQAVIPSPTPSDVVGTWELEKVLLNGTEQAAAYTQTFTFKADNTVKLTVTSLSGTVTKNGTYVVDGTTINVTVYGSTSTLTLAQGKLVLVQQNGNDTITMIFKSQQPSSTTPTINIAGTYNYTSYIVDGVEKIDTDGYSGKIIFNADNTFSLEETVDSVTNTYSGNYVINGTRVIACGSEGNYFEFVIDADKNIVDAFVYEDENYDCHSLVITAKAENSSASQNADFVGSWKMTSSFFDGMENVSPTCSNFSISLAQDGTFTTYAVGTALDDGTYEVTGNVAIATSSDNSWIYTLILGYDGKLIDFIYYYYSTEGHKLEVSTYEKGDDVSVAPVVPSNIVGTWTSIDDEYTFYQDGKATVTVNGSTVNGVYLFKNNEVKVLVDDVISLSLDQNGFLIQGSGSTKNVFKKHVTSVAGSWKFSGSQDLPFTSEVTFTEDGEFSWTTFASATESSTIRGTYVAYDDTVILVDSDGNFSALMRIVGNDDLDCSFISSGSYASAVHKRQPDALLSEIVGTWDFYKLLNGGVDQSPINISYTFNSDGTVSETYDGTTSNGTFTILGNVINISGIVPYEFSFVYTAEKTLEQLGEFGSLLILKKNSLDVVGTWNCIEYKVNGTVESSDISAEFKSDGTLVWSELGDSTNGTYSVSGNVVTITVNGTTLSLTLGENETMSCQIDAGGDAISCVLQKEFSFIGTWNCVSFKVDGTEQSPLPHITITFFADNTLTITEQFGTTSGTYTIENGVATAILEGNTVVFTPNPDRTIYYTINSGEGPFKKQSSSSTSNAFVGTWIETMNENVSYKFNANGSVTLTVGENVSNGTYVVSGNTATATISGNTITFYMDEQGVLYDNADSIYIKQSTTSLADVIVGTWTSTIGQGSIVYTFNADGSVTLSINGNPSNGTYVVSGNTVTATFSEGSYTLTLSAQGKLVDNAITNYVFEKQSITSLADVIVGTWTNVSGSSNVIYTFNANGSVTLTIGTISHDGTYAVSGNTVTVTISDNTNTLNLNAQGDLIDGEYIFKKQATTSLADVIVGNWTNASTGGIIYTFNSNGSVTLTSGGLSNDGTYVVSGNTVTATISGTTYTLTLNAQDNLVDALEGIVFTKQSSSSTSLADVIVGDWTNASTVGIIIYTFNADGSVSLNVNGDVRNGTYVVSGNTVTVTISGSTNTLTLNAQGDLIDGDIAFKKQTPSIPLAKITGSWRYTGGNDVTLSFDARGNATLNVSGTLSNGTYSVVGDVVVVTIENMSYSLIFKLNGADNLVEIVDNFVFTRQTSLTKADVVGEWIINKRYKQSEKQYINEIYVLTLTDDDFYTIYDDNALVMRGSYELIGSSIFLFVDDSDVYGFTLSNDGQLINIQPDYDSEYNYITIFKKTLYTTNVVGTWGLESYVENGATTSIDYTENVVFYDNGTFTLTGVNLSNDSVQTYSGTYVTYANVVTLYEGNDYFAHFTIDENGNLVEKGELFSGAYFIRTYANISSLVGTWNLTRYFVDDEEQSLTFSQKIAFNGNGTFTMTYTSDSTFSLSGTYVVNKSTIMLYENGSLFSTLTLDENGVLYTEEFNELTSSLTVGKYDKDFDLVGIWELKKYTENGVDRPFTFTQTVEFKADGTLIYTTSDDENDVINATYSIVGNAIKVYEEDELIATLSLSNGRLLLTQTDSSNTYVWAFTQKINVPANGVVGTWDCIKYEINGVNQPSSIIYTFNADGTLTLTTVGDTYNGTYTFSNGIVTVNCAGSTHVLTLNAQGYLVEANQIETIIFQKRNDSNAIAGTWTCEDASYCYVFNTDGTFIVITSSRTLYGTYTISNNDVTMTVNGITQTATLNAQGDLIDGDYVFKKQSSTPTSNIVGIWTCEISSISYVFNADGTFSMTSASTSIPIQGTYSVSGNTVTATFDDGSFTLTLNAQGNLVDDDYGYVFEKQATTSLADVIVGTWVDVTDEGISYKFDANGNVKLTLGTTSYDGTYVVSGNTVTATVGGDTDTFTLNAQGNLVVNYGNVFEKQSSSSFTFKTGVYDLTSYTENGTNVSLNNSEQLRFSNDNSFTLYVYDNVTGTDSTINGTYVVNSANKVIHLSTATETNFIALSIDSDGKLVFNFLMPAEGAPKACVKTYTYVDEAQ